MSHTTQYPSFPAVATCGFVLPVSEDPSRKLMPHSLEPLVMTLVKEILANMWSESKRIAKRTVVPKG